MKPSEFLEVLEMTSSDCDLKVKAAQAKVAKIEALIEKVYQQSVKKLEKHQQEKDEQKRQWIWWEYEQKNEQIEDNRKKLVAAKEAVAKWQEKYNAALKREADLENLVPQAMKEARDEMIVRWNEYDKEQRTKLKAAYDEYKEKSKNYHVVSEERHELYMNFIGEWGADYQDRMYETDEHINQRNIKDANEWCLNLYYRVHEFVGEVTDCEGLVFVGKALNGVVHGTKGNARVETIEAGGYNIQRWHLRVLVHKWKEGK